MEFEEIYRTYFNAVFHYIRRISGDAHIAEEITADTFFKAMRAIDSFRGDCDIRIWLCQIAKNTYFSYRKKHERFCDLEAAAPNHCACLAEDIEDALIRQDDAVRIQRVLHLIPDPYKEVFMWRVFAELSFKQIGELFGKTENWACVTYHRARKKIKDSLEAQDNEK